MTTSLPTIVPTGYAGDTTDFTKTKVDRSGAFRICTGSVSIPASTASATVVGLMPINKGFKLGYGSRVYAAALDTNTALTLDIGYTYYDSTTGTSSTAGYVSASTAGRAGGMIEMTAVTDMKTTAAADGWITVTTGGGSTTTTGSLTFNLEFAYDPSGVTNP